MPSFIGNPDQFAGHPENTWKDTKMELTSVERLKSLGAEVKKMQKQMREAATEAVAEGTKAIFDEYGDLIYQFGWIQYTPYFNDGDPCEFGMHELWVIAKEDIETLKAEHPDEDDFEDALSDAEFDYEGSPSFSTYGGKVRKAYYRGEANPDFDQRYADAYEACRTIYDVCAGDGQQIARDIFGDHVKVIFTPDGVDVEEYEHE